MSVICKTSNITPDVANRLHNDLTVLSILPAGVTKPKFYNGEYQQPKYQQEQKRIECFSFFTAQTSNNEKVTFVCLPFSYYYHHLTEKVPRLPLPKHPSISTQFQGTLLQRQADIKDQALEILTRTGSLLLCLHTGFGKTIFTLYLASCLGLKVIVLCHRSIIIDQWIDSCNKYLPGLRTAVLEVSDFKKNEDCWSEVDVLVCNVINVPKIPAKAFKQFGCVIVDEVHTICTQEFSKSLHSLIPKYLIGLSATPFRSDGMDTLLELYFGPEIIIRNMQRFFNAYRMNTKFVPEQEDSHWSSLLRSQAQDADRNKLICKLVWYFRHRTILVLVKHKGQANKLKKWLIALGLDADVFMDTMKKVNFDCQVLIATYSKGGVGFDHPKLDLLITGADVKENFIQYLGRVFRRDNTIPMYIDLRDDLPILQEHSRSRLKLCEEIGAKVLDFHKTFKSFSWLTKWIDTHDQLH